MFFHKAYIMKQAYNETHERLVWMNFLIKVFFIERPWNKVEPEDT